MLDPHIEKLNTRLSLALDNAGRLTGDPQLHAAKLAEHYARALAALSPPKPAPYTPEVVVFSSGGGYDRRVIRGVKCYPSDVAAGVWRMQVTLAEGLHCWDASDKASAIAERDRILAEWRGTA